MTDARQYAPATSRNREPILTVLKQVLPPSGTILEIASGTGEHAVFFAPKLPQHTWLPSDVNPLALESIGAWQAAVPTENLLPPLRLDVSQPQWSSLVKSALNSGPVTAIVAINMVHISPWSATVGLLAGVPQLVAPGGVLYLYGPYRREGEHTAPSNAAFDASLRSRDPEWGVRDLEAVVQEAELHQLQLETVVEMPANNLSVIFRVS